MPNISRHIHDLLHSDKIAQKYIKSLKTEPSIHSGNFVKILTDYQNYFAAEEIVLSLK